MRIVVDIGNSAFHFAEFGADGLLDEPLRTLHLPCDEVGFDRLEQWLSATKAKLEWTIGSVNPDRRDRLVDWIYDRNESCHVVTFEDLPIEVMVKQPHTVGVDRLAAATAANALRSGLHPAIVIDAGTAITIDCISADGKFLGGTIAPGLQMSFRSLHDETAQLPLSNLAQVPGLIGDSTLPAIQSGVYWMTVGGINGLIERLQEELVSPCSIFATGGSMSQLLPNLRGRLDHRPHLVLSGLALAKR